MSDSGNIDGEHLEGEPNIPAHTLTPLEEQRPTNIIGGNSFADYKANGRYWITLVTGEYYPDILKDARALYEPVLVTFGKLLQQSESSIRLLISIADLNPQWMRIQVARVFRKYVSPETPVEMLKKKKKGSGDHRAVWSNFSAYSGSSSRL